MQMSLSILSTLILGATLSSGLSQHTNSTGGTKKLLLGGPPFIAAADFNGASFNIRTKINQPGTAATWMLFREPNLLYAVDESSKNTRLFNFDIATMDLKLVQNATGSSGVVSLVLNQDKTLLFGASYEQGQIDVWDVSGPSGTLKFLKQIPAGGTPGPFKARQDGSHPHQVLFDPTGRFLTVTDLGTDSILVFDSQKDFSLTKRVTVTAGSGPRHGAFISLGADSTTSPKATHYMLACELTSVIKAFELTYAGDELEFKEVQTVSTYGAAFPPANATSAVAAELVASSDGRHVYVSNRLTGNATDSISHFLVAKDGGGNGKEGPLAFADQVSSGGLIPRMFSLARDENVLYAANQKGENGLLAFKRDAKTGSLTETPLAKLALVEFGGGQPQFVMEVGAK